MTNFSQKVIITWSFWTWKTTIIKLLEELGYPIIHENSRKVLNELWKSNQDFTTLELEEFQKKLVKLQIEEEQKKKHFITDTSLLENLAYWVWLNCYNELQRLVEEHLKDYHYIFYFPLLSDLEDDWTRYNDREYQKEIDNIIKRLYEKYWYNIIEVPVTGNSISEEIENKLKFILEKIK